jgi:orotidine-5'-phosphate decarboxylase
VAGNFSDRLCNAVKAKNNPLCVGIDPVYERLPKQIREHKQMNDPSDVESAIDAVSDFCTKVLRVVGPLVPAVKINIAYFEKYLWEGLECYYSLITEADDLGLEIIGDVKRGDIGHTSEAYAMAHLENPEFTGLEDIITPDAITVNGFAGAEGIIPFADTASQQGKGIFVWIRSSNPTAAAVQDFADASGKKMYQKYAEVVAEIANQNKRLGAEGYSNVGMVVGGTTPQETAKLREIYPNIWFLVPGLGAQNATPADCLRFTNKDGLGALINSSRSIIYAYEKPKYRDQFGDDWQKCIEQATKDTIAEIEKAKQ